MTGWKTYTVAVIVIANAVLVAMGWTPDPATSDGLAAIAARIVAFLQNPIVIGAVMAIMRWWTQRTTIEPLEAAAGPAAAARAKNTGY